MVKLSQLGNLFARDQKQTARELIRLQAYRPSPRPTPPRSDDHEVDPQRSASPKIRGTRTSSFVYHAILPIKTFQRAWDRKFPGWRGGLATFSILATLILIVNMSALIWAATHLDDGWYATVQIRSCKKVQRWSSWIHLIINLLSVALLAGSNYCMQCLTSPTRDEVDAAHAKASYLNVGILSWRNIMACRKRRILLLLALGLSSVPLHAVSSVGTRKAIQVYDRVALTPSFFPNHTTAQHDMNHTWTPKNHFPYSLRFYDSRIRDLRNTFFDDDQALKYVDGRLRNLQGLSKDGQIWNTTRWAIFSAAECHDDAPYQSDRGSVLAIAEEPYFWAKPVDTELPTQSQSKQAISVPYIFRGPLDWEHRWFPLHIQEDIILYCLALIVPDRCRLQINLLPLLSVVICNIVKLACFLVTYWEQRGAPLMTAGDALASFLSTPCQQFRGMCLLSEKEVMRVVRARRLGLTNDEQTEPRQFEAKVLRYYGSASLRRWYTYVASCVLLLAVSGYQYNEILIKYRNESKPTSVSDLWKNGIGKPTIDSEVPTPPPWCNIEHRETFYACRDAGIELFHFLLTSFPQLVVSAVYLFVNYQVTLVIHLRDWTKLGLHKQPLRVSNPEPASVQKSTYWLSLPYKYSLPLLSTSVALGWLVSQALFSYRFVYYDNDGSVFPFSDRLRKNPKFKFMTMIEPEVQHRLAYSPMAVVAAIVVGLCVFVVSVALGMQRCASGLGSGPTNSLVIAAACQPPHNDQNAARKMVQWGVVHADEDSDDRDLVQHCTITSHAVKEPQKGRWYA